MAAARDADNRRLERRVRTKVRGDMAQARAWGPQFETLPSALADRKLCEYTRVLLLSALEQRVYAVIEAKPDAPKPVGLWKKYLAWLVMAGLTLYPMYVSLLRFQVAARPPPPAQTRQQPTPADIATTPCLKNIDT